MTVPDYSSVFLILPLEILLPLLGILLIRSASPTNGLIYRSFLGSIVRCYMQVLVLLVWP